MLVALLIAWLIVPLNFLKFSFILKTAACETCKLTREHKKQLCFKWNLTSAFAFLFIILFQLKVWMWLCLLQYSIISLCLLFNLSFDKMKLNLSKSDRGRKVIWQAWSNIKSISNKSEFLYKRMIIHWYFEYGLIINNCAIISHMNTLDHAVRCGMCIWHECYPIGWNIIRHHLPRKKSAILNNDLNAPPNLSCASFIELPLYWMQQFCFQGENHRPTPTLLCTREKIVNAIT